MGKIDEARCPVLIAHGANDLEVPSAQARAIYEAARPPKRLLIVPGAGHGLPVSDDRRYLREVAQFFIERR